MTLRRGCYHQAAKDTFLPARPWIGSCPEFEDLTLTGVPDRELVEVSAPPRALALPAETRPALIASRWYGAKV